MGLGIFKIQCTYDDCAVTLSGHQHHSLYEGESISNQPNLFTVEIHLFFFDAIAL